MTAIARIDRPRARAVLLDPGFGAAPFMDMSLHDPTEANLWTGDDGVGAVTFSGEERNQCGVYMPASVARAVHAAFVAAMAEHEAAEAPAASVEDAA